ncbi:MAG: lysine exporter LysO family protein [Angelakisella sp.]|nr:lysine exporter LysO family protein [Angelakisella sp.]
MIIVILASLAAGIVCGRFWFDPAIVEIADSTLLGWALNFLVLAVGIEMGSDKSLIGKLRSHGFKILLLPLGVAVGSVLGGILIGWVIGMPMGESAAVSAGFGWYSISAVLLKDMAGARIATLAFLTNVVRELMALMVIPIVAKVFGKLPAIAPGGATSMDTTLPIIVKSTDEATGAVAVITGVCCSMMVPVVVPLLYQLFS